MDIKYFVRTTGERVLDKSYEQIEYTLLIDKEHKPIQSFIDQLNIISEYNAVLLEDDCILCDNFKENIKQVINNYPTDIINFFTRPLDYFITQYSTTFLYNQCTFYPQGTGKLIANKMQDLWKIFTDIRGYDYLEDKALQVLGMAHLQYRPALVQHNDKKSIINTSHESRITPYYIDYLKELNIDYNSATCILSRGKLLNCRNKHLHLLGYK